MLRPTMSRTISVLGDLLGPRIAARHGRAVAQDGHRVGDAAHLVQLVADDDRGHALRLQLQNQVEQRLAVGFRQCRGRLVEDQQPHFLRQRLGDLDQLLLADAQAVHQRLRRLAQADLAQQLLRPLERLLPVDHPAGRAFVAQKQVLGDRQQRHQRQLLVDDDDPPPFAVADPGEPGELAVVEDFALVIPVRVDARQHLHQGRLARAVLADKRVDLALFDGEADVVERLDPRKGLGDGPHLEKRAHGRPRVTGRGNNRPRHGHCRTYWISDMS